MVVMADNLHVEDERKKRRLERQREAYKKRKVSETSDEREIRLMKERERRQKHKAAETSEQREFRLMKERERRRKYRAMETNEQREVRLMKEREKQCQKHQTISEDSRQTRLELMRHDAHQRRAEEDNDTRERRLELMRQDAHHRQAEEDNDTRERRLELMRQDAHHRQAEEDNDTRERRLELMRQDAHHRRAEEDNDTRERRLELMRQDAHHRRAEEDDDTREERLEQCQAAREAATPWHDTDAAGHFGTIPRFDQQSVLTKLSMFHSKLANCNFNLCSCCNESFPSIKLSMCNKCQRCTRDDKQPSLYSSANNMDPGPVPLCLQGLSQVEEMLISPVLPMMCVYRLPLGQLSYGGHIINFPQDVSTFVTSLPRNPNNIDIVVVRKEGTNSTHKDFRVRRSRVFNALQWLKLNNKYFNGISINNSTLLQLPEDDNLSGFSVLTVQDDYEQSDGDATGCSFVPLSYCRETEQETILNSVSDRQQHPVLWPSLGRTPIDEFHSEGYFSCAFPTLFPTGAADYTAPRHRPVTIGYYLKHLMLYKDGRYAKHPRFPYFALNTEMRWRALQAGRIYIRQHPEDARMTITELHQLVNPTAFSNKVLHYAATLRGTRPYWMRQRTRLISMVDCLGLPTIFFTHSAADLQWPELAKLICPMPEDRVAHSKAVIANPAVADWFFYERVRHFIRYFYQDILKVKDYWLRFEWQHRGSPHVHGLAWLPNSPDIETIFTTDSTNEERQQALRYVDALVTTINPGVLPDGTNLHAAPLPVTNPDHICNKPFSEVQDYLDDLKKLVATCERHTTCSTAYCLRTVNGSQVCRFNFPKDLLLNTAVRIDNGEVELITARNDPLVNRFNNIQLLGWRGNVDMQYCVSRTKVIQYCAKYTTKCEPRSQSLKEICTSIIKGLNEDDKPLKAVQKLLISSTAERDFSAQETCHLLLQLPLYMASRDFVILSVDGSREVEENLIEGQPAVALSILDNYLVRPRASHFEHMTLLYFAKHYSFKKGETQPVLKNKAVVVIVRPYCCSDPNGPNYNQYCKQKLMLHKPFRTFQQLLNGHDTYIASYKEFLESGNVPPCLEDDVTRLLNQQQQLQFDVNADIDSDTCTPAVRRTMEDWMQICFQFNEQLEDASAEHIDWLEASQQYPHIEEAPRFIS